MKTLLELGFKKIGFWNISDKTLSFKIDSFSFDSEIVFAFAIKDTIKYVGISEGQLKIFLENFIYNKNSDIATSAINKIILKSLKTEKVEIYALKNKKFFGFVTKFSSSDLDNLIKKLSPEWNEFNLKSRVQEIIKKDRVAINKVEKEKQKTKTVVSTKKVSKKDSKEKPSYIFVMSKSYFDRGFFNVKTPYSDLVGPDKTDIHIVLADDKTIPGKINRTANATGAPRIVGNKPLRLWLTKHSGVNKELKITFINKKKVRLDCID